MATGIRKLHSRACRSRSGRCCNCGAGWEAAVYSHREGKKIRKTFAMWTSPKNAARCSSWDIGGGIDQTLELDKDDLEELDD